MSFSGIITSQRALEIAQSALNLSSEISTALVNLTVSDIGIGSASDDSATIRLIWRIVVNKDIGRKDVLVDAFTGEILEVQVFREQVELPSVHHSDPITALWIIPMALAAASTIYVVMERRMAPYP